MSLTATVLAGVAQAFAAAGDLAQSVSIRRAALGPYSTTASVATETVTDYPFLAVVTADAREIEGGLVKRKVGLLLKTGAVEPATTDRVVVGGDVLRVLKVERIMAGAVPAAFKIEAET